MQIDRESINEHAKERLDTAALAGHGGPVEAFRRFLKIETERLRRRHRFGLPGSEIATGRSYQVDMVVSRVCQLAAEEAERSAQRDLAQCAVVALGGYGRGELAPFSDVDLLFLHGGRPREAVKRFVERALQLLWDSGLTVGHSFRSPKECVAEARDDLHSRTALVEARLVAGNAELFQALQRQAEQELFRSRRATDDFLALLRAELAERHARFGEAVCVQEPNVKEGCGGMRDLHAVTWIGHARFGSRGLAGLRAESWIGEAEYVSARRAYDFLSRVRNEAHFRTGRKTDLLVLDLQPELAQGLGYTSRGGLLASEIFMREYYRRASELHRLCRTFVLRHLDPAPRRLLAGLRLRPRPRRGVEVRQGRLHTRGATGVLRGGPAHVLEAFEVAQAEGVLPSEELKLAVRERAPLIDRPFRGSREAVRAFLKILGRRGRVAPALRAMHETGVLGRLLPEFGRVTFLVQHDLFHRYTVDEHTLKAIEALDDVALGADAAQAAFGRVFDELPDATPLYLGLLLHDIGKGRGGGHVARGVKIAARVCERLRLPAETAESVLFLVGAHLEMSQVSQQRDLTEPGLIEAFARRVGTLERLNLLLLLTYADHRGVGPGIWNEWKAWLLWELYGRTRARLAGGEAGADDAGASEAAIVRLRHEFPAEQVERHLALLPERYLRSTDAACLERHFRLMASRGERPAAFEWRDLPAGHGSELVVTADDRPGLFARLAGTLTAHGVDILSVDLFGRDDGVVLDTFRLATLPGHGPVDAERRERIERALSDAVVGKLDVARAVERWRARAPRRPRRHWGRAARGPSVRFDQEASAVATVVEVKAPDEPGLAWTIAVTLAQLGLDITFARIATAKVLALDVFYVRDAERRKLTPQAMAEVEAALLAALGAKPRK